MKSSASVQCWRTEMCAAALAALPNTAPALFSCCPGDKTVRLWSLADGSCLRTFEGHLASVLRLDFLSAGGLPGSCEGRVTRIRSAAGLPGSCKAVAVTAGFALQQVSG